MDRAVATAAANGTGERAGVRLVLGTLDLPDTRLAPRLLDRYVDAGGRALDVANVYGDGEASRAVGRWLARGPAHRPVLYAKGCHPPHCRPDLVAAEAQVHVGERGQRTEPLRDVLDAQRVRFQAIPPRGGRRPGRLRPGHRGSGQPVVPNR